MDGVLYVAIGDRYLKAAAASAGSLRDAMPTIPVAIATEGSPPDIFDTALPAEGADGYRAKITAMLRTPFERTLMLDADTYVADDLSEVFRLLDVFDVAAAHAPNRVTFALDDVPDSFPELNTGVIAFRRSRCVDELLRDWLAEYDRLAPLGPPSWDQPSFRRVVYSARALRLAVLPPEFNFRFRMAGFHNQRVRLLHGWPASRPYFDVAALLNGHVARWDDAGVFAADTLFDRAGHVIGRFDRPDDESDPGEPQRSHLLARHLARFLRP